MKVSELNANHLGQEILVEAPYWYIGGALESVRHEDVFVEETTLCDPGFRKIKAGTVSTLIVSGWERTIRSYETVGVDFL